MLSSLNCKRDGRKSFTDIASTLDVTSSTVKNRYLRLVEEGVVAVQGYINPYRVGFRTHAIILVKVRAGQVEAVAEAVAAFHEVDFVAITTGDYDLDMTVSCRDQEHLLELINRNLHGVDGVRSDQKSTMDFCASSKSKQGNIERLLSTGRPETGDLALP